MDKDGIIPKFKQNDRVLIKGKSGVYIVLSSFFHKGISVYNLSDRKVVREIDLTLVSETVEPVKLDTGKPRMDLIRPEFMLELGKALEYGQNKYGEVQGDAPNYLKGKGFLYSRIIGSTMRHFISWCSGQQTDEESGINHLILATVNLMFLFTYDISDKGVDDRVILDAIKEK